MPYLSNPHKFITLAYLAYASLSLAAVGACSSDEPASEQALDEDSGTAQPDVAALADAGVSETSPDSAVTSAPVVDAGAKAPRLTGPESIKWPSGTDGLDQVFFSNFGDWRGLAPKASWINAHYQHWDWLTEPGVLTSLDGGETITKLWDMVGSWDGIAVLSMSMAGADELTPAEYDDAMRQCAEGEFDDEWKTFAANATAAGRTGKNTVVSLAHEFNGTWFQWNPGTVGLDTWFGCWRHVYRAIKSASDIRIVWVFSATTHNFKAGDYAVASAWDAYPGDEYVDIIGVNRYDFQMLGERDNTDWRETCGNEQDLCYAADYARKHGKLLAVPEWSIERTETGYGDNPKFIDMMHGFFSDNADILAFESNFNNGGLGYWHLFPTDDTNTKASQRYRELW
jgi:hypothetical protein